MKKVSVVIPVYNMEKYIGRALESLLAQTYTNWEAVMVDDGSTDKSTSIAEQYCRNDKRFLLAKQENQGQGVARNYAVTLASGDYVMYLDPDDMFHPQAMEICVNASLRDDSDMVTFTYDHLYRFLNKWRHKLGFSDVQPRPKLYKDYNYFVTNNIFEHATERSHPRGVDKKWMVKHCQAWRCLLKADLARKAKFAVGVNYQDVTWWGDVLLNVKKTTITHLPLYYYYPNPRSFIMSANIDKHIHSLKVIIEQTDKQFLDAKAEQREAWNINFRTPFSRMLEKKIKKRQKINK